VRGGGRVIGGGWARGWWGGRSGGGGTGGGLNSGGAMVVLSALVLNLFFVVRLDPVVSLFPLSLLSPRLLRPPWMCPRIFLASCVALDLIGVMHFTSTGSVQRFSLALFCWWLPWRWWDLMCDVGGDVSAVCGFGTVVLLGLGSFGYGCCLACATVSRPPDVAVSGDWGIRRAEEVAMTHCSRLWACGVRPHYVRLLNSLFSRPPASLPPLNPSLFPSALTDPSNPLASPPLC
jgi:hypothetical protein